MLRRSTYVLATTAVTAATLFTGAGAASAAHCLDASRTSPGFSYFGTDHVQEATHKEGGNPGPHMGTPGASNCRETTGSPADRAPGRQ